MDCDFWDDLRLRVYPSSSDEDEDEEETQFIDANDDEVEDEANQMASAQRSMTFDPPTFEFAVDDSVWDNIRLQRATGATATSPKGDGVVHAAAAAAATATTTPVAAAGPPSPWRTSAAKHSIIDELKDPSSDVHKSCSTEAQMKEYFKQVRIMACTQTF